MSTVLYDLGGSLYTVFTTLGGRARPRTVNAVSI